jgi:signal transduction histidine kinase
VVDNSLFGIFSDASIPIQTEALIQWALATESYLTLNVDNLPPKTRKWLNTPDKGQILVMALRTNTDYEITGVVLLADYQERHWSEQNLSATATLISQLAWWRREKQITRLLESTTEDLRQLNWYKHRRLEEIQRITALSLKQIHTLGIPANELAQMRYELLLRQLDHTAASMSGMLKLEQWQLHISWETMPIASLLKRSLERIENLLKHQKLWIGVHGLGQQIEEQSPNNSSLTKGIPTSSIQSAMAIAGDIVKIELVIHELLVNACNCSQSGGRIDIWCRRLDPSKPSNAKYSSESGGTDHQTSLELSITYNGAIEPQLLTELHDNRPKDVLAPSKLDQPPGLHLLICQNLMQVLGGELNFYQLPDNRVVSRLLLTLVDHNS